jgi:uncharacterized membrane protein
MKQLVAGLMSCLAGILLCGMNWLGAASAASVLTEWDGTRMSTAWKLVGRGPLVLGVVLIVVGLILVLWSVIEATKVGQQ